MVSYVASDASGPTDATINLTTPTGTTGDEIVALGAGYQVASSVPPFFDGDSTFLADFTDTASENASTDTVGSARLRTTDGTEETTYGMNHDRDSYGAFVAMVRTDPAQLQSTSGGVYSNSGSHNVPAMTIDTDGSIIVLMCVGFNSAPTTSDYTTAGYTQRETLDGGFFQVFTKEVNAGSESAITGASDANAINIAIVLEPADVATVRQEGYRWREDGTEASPTWEAAQDTVAEMAVETTQILRAIVEEYGSVDYADGYSWKWRHEDDSLWTDPGVVRGSIDFVGSDSGQQGANTTDITLTMPGAAAEDDIAIIYARADEAGTVPTLSLQTATGWTQVVDENPTSGRDRVEAVWWKRIGASEANPVVQIDTAEEHSASLHVFTGVDTVTALDATTAFNSGQNDATPTAVGITTVTANAAVVIGHGATHDDIDTAVPPSGYTLGEAVIGATNDHRGQVVAYDLDVGAAAAQSPGDWLHEVSAAATAEWSVWAIALRPASSIAAFDWSASANIANGGTDTTTAQLTAPAGKTTGDHDAGRRADDGATESFTITADDYSELEFAIEAHANAVAGETYQFKVVKDSGADLDAYPVTIQWTIPSGGGTAHTASFTESTAGSDTIAKASTQVRELTDTTAGSDTLAPAKSIFAELAETVAPSDTVGPGQGHGRDFTDATAGSDTLATAMAIVRDLTDAMAPTDSIEVAAQFQRDLVDGMGITDALATAVDAVRSFVESTTGSDTLVGLLAGDGEESFTDAMGISDTLAASLDAVRSFTETTTATDTLVASLGIVRELIESTTGTDTIDRQADVVRSFTEATTGSDTLARAHTQLRALTETTVGSDTLDDRLTTPVTGSAGYGCTALARRHGVTGLERRYGVARLGRRFGSIALERSKRP